MLALLWGTALWAGCGAPAPAAVSAAHRSGPARVRPGIEVLLSDSVALVRARRVGLVTNQSGIDAAGRGDVELLRDAGIKLVALFSPEHGFRGAAAPGAVVASTIDSATGLPIYSLYGRTSAPTDSMLAGIDVMVVDLQDAGARYYTYISTTVEVMKASTRHGIPVIVLDRPDPIGGTVQGNVLDPAFTSFVGRLAVPMRYGMTLGELARLADADFAIHSKLTVVPAAGWRRDMTLDEAGLPFVPPSPNLRTLESLFHYPGTCLFEGTNLSVGRGSDAPFEQIGAPWLDTSAVLSRIRAERLPGVAFASTAFTPHQPGDGKYADTLLAGIRLRVTDRATYDPTVTAVHLMSAIRAVHPDRMRWSAAQFDRLAGGPTLRTALEAGRPAAEIVAPWADGIRTFAARRRPFLIY
ncbi:MAG: exo-beta-N-acetylmuramidase NamZ domain-containing protein [Bacillota bacterium]|jgi:uncharacterized protein YbbC (DUF1343 family)